MPYAGDQYYEMQGTGSPLVLLHGNSLDHRMWEAQVSRLSTQFQVIAVDLRGHGRTGAHTEGPALADDLARLLRHLGLARAAICGLSLGGAVAVSFALHYPEMCAALITIDTYIFGYQFTQWGGARPYVLQAREKKELIPALEGWLQDPLFAPARASRAAARLREIVLDFSGDAWITPSGLPCPPGPPEVERLNEIAVPTLVLVGELDLPDFQTMSGLLASQVAGARLTLIAGAGHMASMEEPDQVSTEIEAFLHTIGAW